MSDETELHINSHNVPNVIYFSHVILWVATRTFYYYFFFFYFFFLFYYALLVSWSTRESFSRLAITSSWTTISGNFVPMFYDHQLSFISLSIWFHHGYSWAAPTTIWHSFAKDFSSCCPVCPQLAVELLQIRETVSQLYYWTAGWIIKLTRITSAEIDLDCNYSATSLKFRFKGRQRYRKTLVELPQK